VPSEVSVTEIASTNVYVTPSGQTVVEVMAGPAQQVVAATAPAYEQRVTTTSDQKVDVQELGIKGEKGDKGDEGAPGAAAQKNFAVASTQWIFDHNLGYPPAVMVYDTNGRVIDANIVENTAERTVVDWYYAMAGSMSVS
jgi:hypothetical protein